MSNVFIVVRGITSSHIILLGESGLRPAVSVSFAINHSDYVGSPRVHLLQRDQIYATRGQIFETSYELRSSQLIS